MSTPSQIKSLQKSIYATTILIIRQWDRYMRIIRGVPLKHEAVLEKVVNDAKNEKNVLGILLFGSVASGTHTWNSDIDLIFVYETCEPASGLVDRFVDGILVQYFFTTLDTLVQNQEAVPYLLYMFCDGKILYDRNNSVAPIVSRLKQYFAAHPKVEADWMQFKELHQEEKKGPECAQKTIIQRWDELENKYSGGVRRRTFFTM